MSGLKLKGDRFKNKCVFCNKIVFWSDSWGLAWNSLGICHNECNKK